MAQKILQVVASSVLSCLVYRTSEKSFAFMPSLTSRAQIIIKKQLKEIA